MRLHFLWPRVRSPPHCIQAATQHAGAFPKHQGTGREANMGARLHNKPRCQLGLHIYASSTITGYTNGTNSAKELIHASLASGLEDKRISELLVFPGQPQNDSFGRPPLSSKSLLCSQSQEGSTSPRGFSCLPLALA